MGSLTISLSLDSLSTRAKSHPCWPGRPGLQTCLLLLAPIYTSAPRMTNSRPWLWTTQMTIPVKTYPILCEKDEAFSDHLGQKRFPPCDSILDGFAASRRNDSYSPAEYQALASGESHHLARLLFLPLLPQMLTAQV